MNYPYMNDDKAAKKLKDWWGNLEKNRADRAVLRRVTNTEDILTNQASWDFINFMPNSWNNRKHPITEFEKSFIAALVANIKEDDSKHDFAETLALPREKIENPHLASAKIKNKKPIMSELRFRKLQKSLNPEEFFMRMRRAIDLLKGKVNIISIVNDTLHWFDEYLYGKSLNPQNRLVVIWATNYYTSLKK